MELQSQLSARDSEIHLRNIADHAPVSIWVIDRDRRLRFLSPDTGVLASAHSRGVIDTAWTLIHPDDRERVWAKHVAAVESRSALRIECRIRRPNGTYRWMLHTSIPHFINGAYVGHVGSSIDITALKRRHERSLAAFQVESIEALAAGIAHNFNNLLGGIYGASDLALSDLPPDSPARDSIERVNSLATRGSEIVNLLLTYAGAQGAATESVDLSALVTEMVALSKPSISCRTRFELHLAADLPAIRANSTQIRLVVWNLIMNASESLYCGQGTVKVSTERLDTTTGRYCRLVVSDTGCGFAPEAQARLFDPFYTTKFLGRGLGLAVVKGILRSHGGTIHARSMPGVGSVFEVLLPGAAEPGKTTTWTKKAAAGLNSTVTSYLEPFSTGA